MINIMCSTFAYGIYLVGFVIMTIGLIGWIVPEARHTKVIGRVYRTLYFDIDDIEEDS